MSIEPYGGFFNYIVRVRDEDGNQVDYEPTDTWLGAKWSAGKIIRRRERELRRAKRGASYTVARGVTLRGGKNG